MNRIKSLLALVICASAFAWPAHAGLISLSGGNSVLLDGVLGNPTSELAWVKTQTSNDDLEFLYKNLPSVGDPVGAVDGSYFSIAGLGTPSATLSWNLTGTGFQVAYVLLKDGATGGRDSKHIYHLYQVQSGSEIVVSSALVNMGIPYTHKDISHITFLGLPYTPPPPPVPGVPDGGVTMILLGAGLAALGFLRRTLAGC
jgi:hypothetical protein